MSNSTQDTTLLEPFVDADDVADVAVAALTEDGHAGQVLALGCGVTGGVFFAFSAFVMDALERLPSA